MLAFPPAMLLVEAERGTLDIAHTNSVNQIAQVGAWVLSGQRRDSLLNRLSGPKL